MPDNRYAALDLGTNSFHLIIAEADKDGVLKIIEREREVIRLGSHGDNLSIISEDEITKAIIIIKKFKKLSLDNNAVINAVATSAVRESKNRNEFVARVLDETGISINVIEGSKEAKLIYKGAEQALNLHDKKILCIDIGGGSSEFILTELGEFIFSESIKIGAVRLSKKFFPDFILTDERINKCEMYAESKILANSHINLRSEFQIAVGTSGTIQSIARMILASRNPEHPESINGFIFNREELEEIYHIVMAQRTFEQRLMIKNIEIKRADILPAGLIILKKTFELFHINKMQISEYALREGIILKAIENKS